MTTTNPTTETTTDPLTGSAKTIVFVTAEGLPDAWVNGNEIELVITQPVSAVEATIVIPLADALGWAAEVYAAITLACHDHTGDRAALAEFQRAGVPHSGRLIFDRLTDPAD